MTMYATSHSQLPPQGTPSMGRLGMAIAIGCASAFVIIGAAMGAASFGFITAFLIAIPAGIALGALSYLQAGAGKAKADPAAEAKAREQESYLQAINKVQAVIEFDLDGTILWANDIFCTAMGYTLQEIKGQHHSMFVDDDYRKSEEYRGFWGKLRHGQFAEGQFKRLGKGGREVWIIASYNPITDAQGRPYKVVKFARDITEETLKAAEQESQIKAIYKSQAVIEFDPQGNILWANENFCEAMGYKLDEIKGRHHALFVNPDYAQSADYKNFWAQLRQGEYVVGEFTRYNRSGKEVSLQASYNPIYNNSGEVYKVVKFASDVTVADKAKIISDNQRIRTALDVATTNVMLADAHYNIVYMNRAMKEMMSVAEDDLRKELSQFDASRLIGTNIDLFHKNPSHQRTLLDRLTKAYRTALVVGAREFDLIATPVYDEDQNRVGTVVEWADVTQLRKDEREKAQIDRENTRIRSALDNTSTHIMVADANYNIVYMNDTMVDMMENVEDDLRQELKNFDAKKLLGANIDQFHKNPAHQRSMLDRLAKPYHTELKIGMREFSLIASPIIDKHDNRIGTVVEWADVTQIRKDEREKARIAGENRRIRAALDNTTTNVMVADSDCEIVYMNEAQVAMMRDAEADIRKVLTRFDASNLLGQKMDVFHKNPTHQRNLIETLTGTYEADIVVGGRHFHLIANPILDDQNKRLGTVVEWRDETKEKAIEAEIHSVVSAVASGDFSQKVNLDGKDGFHLGLGKSINALASTVFDVLTQLGNMLEALSQGDLTRRIDEEYRGIYETMKNNYNSTASSLGETVREITMAATEVSSAAEEIATGANDLSQRTEQQAANLEETASSMQEMTSTINQNADNAEQASQIAVAARDAASRGGSVVSDAVQAMDRIESSSRSISDIIGVIDEIAFQTNLLALNAAVEAARAGDAGRGFAVVASEVRSLAQRSAQAAKDIKDLIVDSTQQVKSGVDLVNRTGDSLKEIVESVRQVADIVAEISAASREQASGAQEINAAVTQMDEMTQQNSALVEENAAAAKTMSNQAERMNDRLRSFKVDGLASGHGKPQLPYPPAPEMPRPKAVAAKASGGGARGLQTALAESVFEGEDDWSEF